MTLTMLVLLVIAIVVAVVLLNRNTTRREAERAEEYRKAAALRGWHFEFDGFEYRYSGTAEGIPWTVRIAHRRHHRHEAKPLLFETTAVSFERGALVIWPDSGERIDALKVPGVPQFVLELAMRPVAMALGAADADRLASATAVAEGPPGFLFRGTDAARLQQWVNDGADAALTKDLNLIVAVIWPHGLQIATAYGANDLEQIARVVRTGARLARAYGG